VTWTEHDPIAETTTSLAAVTAPAGFVVAVGCQNPPAMGQSGPVRLQWIIPKDAFFRASLGWKSAHPPGTIMVRYLTDTAPTPRERSVAEVWFVYDGRMDGTGRSSLSKAISEAKAQLTVSFEETVPSSRFIGGPFPIPLNGAKEAIASVCKTP